MTALADPQVPFDAAADRDPFRLLPITVNLLPDEVVAARAAQSARRVSIAVLLVALLGTGGWYYSAMSDAADATSRLDAVESQAAQAHRGSNNFGALNTVKTEIKSIRGQLAGATAGDVDWATVNAAVQSAAVPGLTLTGLSNTAATSNASGTPATGGTDSASGPTGTVQINGTAASKSTVSRFIDGLGRNKLFSDAFITNFSSEPKSHKVQFTATLSTTKAALNPRYQKVGK